MNAARINIARNDQRISVLDYRKTLEENLAELERDYWQLYQAQQEVSIQEQLLLETIQTYTTLWERWQRGLIDESAVRQAEVAVYARKASLIQAKQQVRDVSVDIKRRMSDPDIPVSNGEVIIPADLPLVQPLNFATQPQIDEALIHRFELGQQLLRIDSAAIARQVAKNNELPKLDLVGQASFNGVDENESDRAEEPDAVQPLQHADRPAIRVPDRQPRGPLDLPAGRAAVPAGGRAVP